MNIFRRDKSGLTLIEVQAALAIAFLTLLAAVSLYIFYWRTFIIGNNMLDVYSNSRVAVGLIARDIRSSSQVVAQYPETGVPTYQTADSEIVLKVSSIDALGNVIKSQYDYIVYRLADGGDDLHRIVIPFLSGPTPSSRIPENRVVANYCDSLIFSSGGTALSQVTNLSTVNTVGIYLPLNKTTISLSGTGSHVASIVPTTVVRLRNK